MKKFIFLLLCTKVVYADILNINTFEADFKQAIINELDKKIIYSGKVYVKKPMFALWKYKTPIEKDVYLYNNKVYIVEPDLEQVTITKLKDSINFLEIVNNAKKISSNKYITNLGSTKATINTKNNKIVKLQYIDSLSNKVEIDFTNQKVNQEITDDYFRLTIPSEYDIIK
jgi:outer membrane lipoprotein carrier protein